MFIHLVNFVFAYISSKWKVSSGEKFEYYMEFVKIMANVTYENFEMLAPYTNDPQLLKINIMDLVAKVMLYIYMIYNFFSIYYNLNTYT